MATVLTYTPRVERTSKQLDLVLSFFSRAESKMTFVFGVDLAMLAAIAAATPIWQNLQPHMVVVLLPLGLIIGSALHVYWGLFPDLHGPERSVIFFGAIGGSSFDEFRSDWQAADDSILEAQLLDQIWRNAKILNLKFLHLRSAFLYMAAAVLPWAASFAILLWANPAAKSLFGK